MATSWNKRHSLEETDRIRRDRIRFSKWKKGWTDQTGTWKKIPIKIGDSWNPRLGCWNNEIYRGERDPNTGKLTEKGEQRKSERQYGISRISSTLSTGNSTYTNEDLEKASDSTISSIQCPNCSSSTINPESSIVLENIQCASCLAIAGASHQDGGSEV